VPEALRRRLHGPAGIDIGAIDPEEIALAILGEIVQERRRPQRAAQPERLPDD
jgi:xanthine dehydrogenase accessory factor